MTLNSITFIFTCLPILIWVYNVSSKKYRNYILIGSSLLFYAWGEPIYVFLIIISMAYTYLICNWLDDESLSSKQRLNLFIQAIAVHVFALLYLKYYGFILDSIKDIFQLDITYRTLPQPLGISFYTFMILSYIIDVYTHKIKAEKDKTIYAVYVTFFPKLVMGPIERFANMKEQIRNPDTSISSFTIGVERFLGGFAKKVILADTFGMLWNEISTLPITELTVLSAWIGAIAFTLQIYFDFSGYSDMAIGISRMFGFTLMENFNYPYLATSITDFWHRWHISLSSWFRDYIYIPLGGNRVLKQKHIRNILIVWGLTGLWHGASWNFIIWGLYYGCLLLLEKYVWNTAFFKLKPLIRWLITFLLVIIGWVFFASPNLTSAFAYLKVMFFMSGNVISNAQSIWYMISNFMFFIIAFLCMTPFIKNAIVEIKEKKSNVAYFIAVGYGILFMISIAFALSQTYQSFLYTQF